MAEQRDQFHTTVIEVVRAAKICRIIQPEHTPLPVAVDAYQPKIDLYIEGIDESSQFYQQLHSRLGRKFNSVAIEIQSPTSVKHFMGDLINAALNGDVGMVVCPSEKEQKQYERILRYIRHYGLLGNRPYPLVVTAFEFIELLGGQKE